jgi:hypothetical protein
MHLSRHCGLCCPLSAVMHSGSAWACLLISGSDVHEPCEMNISASKDSNGNRCSLSML